VTEISNEHSPEVGDGSVHVARLIDQDIGEELHEIDGTVPIRRFEENFDYWVIQAATTLT